MSYLYSLLFGYPKDSELQPIVEIKMVEPAPIVEVPKTENDLINQCNDLHLYSHGFILSKDSDICYQLRNAAKKEVHLFFVKPSCYPDNPIKYIIGNKEIYYPHIQTMSRLQERMNEYDVNITASNAMVQFGTGESALYLIIKENRLMLTDKCPSNEVVNLIDVL